MADFLRPFEKLGLPKMSLPRLTTLLGKVLHCKYMSYVATVLGVYTANVLDVVFTDVYLPSKYR